MPAITLTFQETRTSIDSNDDDTVKESWSEHTLRFKLTDAPVYRVDEYTPAFQPHRISIEREEQKDGYVSVTVSLNGYRLNADGKVNARQLIDSVYFSGSNSATRKEENFKRMPEYLRELVADHITLPEQQVSA